MRPLFIANVALMASWAGANAKTFSIESMREKLHVARTASDRFDRNLLLMRLECEYKQYIAGRSKAYLSGSPWYVGDSLVRFLEHNHLEADAVHRMVAAAGEATAAPDPTTSPLPPAKNSALLRLICNTIVIPFGPPARELCSGMGIGLRDRGDKRCVM